MSVCAYQGGSVALMASDSQSVLGRAALKYADALALNSNEATYHFHVGRLLVAQGDCVSAIDRLETALSLNDQHQLARSVSQSLAIKLVQFCLSVYFIGFHKKFWLKFIKIFKMGITWCGK